MTYEVKNGKIYNPFTHRWIQDSSENRRRIGMQLKQESRKKYGKDITNMNTKERSILRKTIEWYYNNIKPYSDGEYNSGVVEYLKDAETGMKVGDTKRVLVALDKVYDVADEDGLIKSNIRSPGPGKDFQNLYDNYAKIIWG